MVPRQHKDGDAIISMLTHHFIQQLHHKHFKTFRFSFRVAQSTFKIPICVHSAQCQQWNFFR